MDNFTIDLNPAMKHERTFLLELNNILVFPYGLAPINMEGEGPSTSLRAAMGKDRLLAVFPDLSDNDIDSMPEPHVETFTFNNRKMSTIGTLVRVVKELSMPDESVRIVLRGVKRIKYLYASMDMSGAPVVTYSIVPEDTGADDPKQLEAATRGVVLSFLELASMLPGISEDVAISINNAPSPARTVDQIAEVMNIPYAEKVWFLNTPKVIERLNMATVILNRELEVMHLGTKIQSAVHEAMSASQREFYLREQLKAVQKELNEETRNPDIVELEKRIHESKLPENVSAVVQREFSRLQLIPQAAPEYHISYSYISWILELPWFTVTTDRLNVQQAAKVLDADHYGLEDVKKRILEFLAVLQLRKSSGSSKGDKAPILCLIGPPGVGKTSLGQSIARAMKRNFIRVSLGGVHDEAEIRGHRRTYVGALPGRIIQNIKRAGSANPVFMLDEVDKLAHDMRGDPASALLEVLDPAQNSSFNDNYLELGFDLSRVFFIATANVEDQIPGPLRDRMEIIRLPGYTQFEKHEIAKRYLCKRQIAESGFLPKQVRFTPAAIDAIIEGYTMEAGVRNLEQTIGRVCRRLAQKALCTDDALKSSYTVTPELVKELLGSPRFLPDKVELHPAPGMATGMAWTGAGGVTLPVEVVAIPGGKGNLKITGSIGKVMEESAGAAFTLVRVRGKRWKIKEEFFNEHDFHIHVPDGATPKDGPSAGVTLTMALISCLTQTPLRSKLAMTGEITLSGRVTAVGGIREKVVAALRAGITDIIMPDENRKDYEELPDEVKTPLNFHFVKNVEEAEAQAFERKKK